MEFTEKELVTLSELLKNLGVSQGDMYGTSASGWSAGGTAAFNLNHEECCLVEKILK